jgi:hypothetical protein
MREFTNEEIKKEIALSEQTLREPDERVIRLWERMRITPSRWCQEQYPGGKQFWVIAILGTRCLYYNEVEGGWGWGRYEQWGTISAYHWQQDELHHVVFQTLFAIDYGGTG